MTVLVRGRENNATLGVAVRTQIRQVDKDLPIPPLASLKEHIDRFEATRHFVSWVLGGVGIMALALAALGLYAVAGYIVTTRRHEIGVRVAMGASPSDVVKLVMRSMVLSTAAGLTIGLLGAILFTPVLANYLFEVKPTDPITLSTVTVLLGLVSLGAGYIPARAATRLDPLVTLRGD
jgi:ABC-type antimicrobial peptide transport system permease subunit